MIYLDTYWPLDTKKEIQIEEKCINMISNIIYQIKRAQIKINNGLSFFYTL